MAECAPLLRPTLAAAPPPCPPRSPPSVIPATTRSLYVNTSRTIFPASERGHGLCPRLGCLRRDWFVRFERGRLRAMGSQSLKIKGFRCLISRKVYSRLMRGWRNSKNSERPWFQLSAELAPQSRSVGQPKSPEGLVPSP